MGKIGGAIALVMLLFSAGAMAQGSKLASLKAALEKKEADVDAGYQKSLLDLRVKFEARLDQIIAERKKAGDAKGAEVVEQAKARLGEPLLRKDEAPKALIDAQAIYEKAAAKMAADRQAQMIKFQGLYLTKLREMHAAATKDGDQPTAAAIQRELEQRIPRATKVFAKGGGENSKKIQMALHWLRGKQNADGSWGSSYPVALTGFALLVFAGHGETADSPGYGKNIVRGVDYLVGWASRNNDALGKKGSHLSYEHGIATYALAETYRMNEHNPALIAKIGKCLDRAVKIIIEGQTKAGGWLYGYGANGIGDLSVSGWNIQALKSAQLSGRQYRDLNGALKKTEAYLTSAMAPSGLYRYRVTDKHPGRVSLTGVGVFSRRLLNGGEPLAEEDKSFAAIFTHPPRDYRTVDLYAAYYHGLACFQKGGQTWSDFKAKFQSLILGAQQREGNWFPSGGHLGAVGPDADLYHTMLCALILETSFRAGRLAD